MLHNSSKHSPKLFPYSINNQNYYRFSSKNDLTSNNTTIREKSLSKESSEYPNNTKLSNEAIKNIAKQNYKTVILKKKTQFSKQYESQKAIKCKRSETVHLGASAYSRSHQKDYKIQYIPNENSKQYKHKTLKRRRKNPIVLWNQSPSTIAFVSEKYTIQKSQRFNHFSIYYHDKYEQKNDVQIIKMPYRILEDFKKSLKDANKQAKTQSRCNKTIVNIHRKFQKNQDYQNGCDKVSKNGPANSNLSISYEKKRNNFSKQNHFHQINCQIKQLVNQRNTNFLKKFSDRYNLTDKKNPKKFYQQVNNTFHQSTLATVQSTHKDKKSHSKLTRGGSVSNLSNIQYKSGLSTVQESKKSSQRHIKSYLLVQNKNVTIQKSKNKNQNELFLESIFNAIISEDLNVKPNNNIESQRKSTNKPSNIKQTDNIKKRSQQSVNSVIKNTQQQKYSYQEQSQWCQNPCIDESFQNN